MVGTRFHLRAQVSTESPGAVEPALRRSVPNGSVTRSGNPKEILVEGDLEGTTAQDLNRALLSALRRVEKRTRLRSEWTHGGVAERFFDYVPKGKSRSERPPTSPP
jgi:hypothetical protein